MNHFSHRRVPSDRTSIKTLTLAFLIFWLPSAEGIISEYNLDSNPPCYEGGTWWLMSPCAHHQLGFFRARPENHTFSGTLHQIGERGENRAKQCLKVRPTARRQRKAESPELENQEMKCKELCLFLRTTSITNHLKNAHLAFSQLRPVWATTVIVCECGGAELVVTLM